MHKDAGRPVGAVGGISQEWHGGSSPSSVRHHYRTYGLRLSSQLELPELTATAPCSDPDIDVLIEPLPEAMEGATLRGTWLQFGEARCQMEIRGIARYRIEEGRRILVDPWRSQSSEPGPSPGDVRLYLLGTALGTLLHQRHWLPLHVSALQTPSGVWAFSGPSGAGKSTLGAWLHHTRGWPIVSDDVAVIKPEEALPCLHPGPPRLKLWKDALAALGISRRGLVRDLTRADKYHLSMQQGFLRSPSQPLRALVMLERVDVGEAAALEPIKGLDAFKAIMASLYRPEMGREFNSLERLMQAVAALAGQIAVYRFRRPWVLDELEDGLEPLLRCIQEGAGGDASYEGR